MAYTRSQWNALQAKLPPDDRVSYEEYLSDLGQRQPATPSAAATPTAAASKTAPSAAQFRAAEAATEGRATPTESAIAKTIQTPSPATASKLAAESPTMPAEPSAMPGTSTQTVDDSGKAAALAFGLTEELLTAFPELRNVYNLFLAGNETDAKIAYQKTGYYKNLTDTARQRQTMKATRLEAYKQERDQFILDQQQRLVRRGIRLDDAAFRIVLEQAYDNGLSEAQIDLKALTAFKGALGGETLGDVQALKSYAQAFGVGYQQSMFDQWSKDIFAGILTPEDVQARIRQDSASAFPAYAEQINRGVSMDAIASAYKSSMANILERDPDSITFEDTRLRKALQYTMDGKPAVMPLWEFEKQIRSTPEWMNTKDARDTIESLSFKVLSDWGLA